MNYIDLEEDYEDRCPDGFRIDPNTSQEVPVGLCTKMCSYGEMETRERTQRLHKFEMIPNTNPPQVDIDRCMKMSTRSSAGSGPVRCAELRPWSVLKASLNHLLLDICFRDEDWMFVCDFVYDRLKAIRSDMVIQRIEGKRYIEILEGSIRFLVYSMYKLVCTMKDFTDRIDPDKKIIDMNGRVNGLDSVELTIISEMKMTMKCLRDCINSLIIQYQENVPQSPNRPLFEATNLIVNLPFLHLSNRSETKFQSDRNLRNRYPMFKLVFKMYRRHLVGQHWTALKYLPQLINYPLLLMAYAPAIAQAQINLVVSLKAAHLQRAANNICSINYFADLICPSFLERDLEERTMFARLMGVQFDLYEFKEDRINFKAKPAFSGDQKDESHNETRIFALMMIFGKNWQIFKDSIKQVGLEQTLNPTQPDHQPPFELPEI